MYSNHIELSRLNIKPDSKEVHQGKHFGMELAYLDLGLNIGRNEQAEIIEETINFASLLERLGYKKYWVAEHHGSTAWQSTEIMITLIAGSTDYIKVGSAGVLMRYHSPLLTAQNFALLNTLFYDRIDLGFSKGTIPNELEIFWTQPADFYDNVSTTKQLFELKKNQPNSFGNPPELWVLGSSLETFQFAIENDLNCCLSFCHSSERMDNILWQYELFRSLRKESEHKKLKLGILLSVLAIKKSNEIEEIKRKVHNIGWITNCVGNKRACEDYLTEFKLKFSPDIVVFAGLYISKEMKYRNVEIFSSFFSESLKFK